MKTPFSLGRLGFLVCISWFGVPATANAQTAEWPQFRGPNSNPTAENERLPDRWSTTQNVEWAVELPGRGWSSPIVAGNKIFVTTVLTDGTSKLPQTGTDYSNQYVAELTKQGLSEEEVLKRVTERDIELPGEVNLHYFLICLDLKTGQTVWKNEFHNGQPPGGRHRKNSFASETPVTDGEFVYVYIANLGLFAYDLDGRQIWKKELPSQPIYLDFGTGSSPSLHENQLIIVHDNEEQSFIASYEKSTGALLWKTLRMPPEDATAAAPKSAWVTPYVWQNDVRTEIVTMSPGVAISYDLAGKELWRLGDLTIAPAAGSFAYQGALYLDGGRGKAMIAIRPGAEGEISLAKGTTQNDFVIWSTPRTGTYIPTPAIYQDGLYIVSDNGINPLPLSDRSLCPA